MLGCGESVTAVKDEKLNIEKIKISELLCALRSSWAVI
jgi:hypothetical protein